MQTYAEQLRQVRDSLTPDNWNKGTLFSSKNNQLCMCVHGAAQTIINPEVRRAFENNEVVVAWTGAVRVDRAVNEASRAFCNRAARDGFDARHDRDTNKDLLSIWSNRPDWVNQEKLFNNISYGSLNLHYLMGMFGITTIFNDNPNTTLHMLKDKLSEAAKWAEENEEFLRNN